VAGWVHSEQELLWLAPATPPPLTPEKVLGWLHKDREAFLLWPGNEDQPVGYAELGRMADRPDCMWLAHFLISRSHRGLGFGGSFLHLLLDRAVRGHAARSLTLIVFPDNLAAIRCYQRIGFESDGYETRYFRTVKRRHRLLRMTIGLTGHKAGKTGATTNW
jgi:RimJ/RimL family protein N-acetyltransferase